MTKRLWIFFACVALLTAMLPASAEGVSDLYPILLYDGALLVDANGREIVPAGLYDSFYRLNSEDETSQPQEMLFAAGQETSDGYRYDILDGTGQVVAGDGYESLFFLNGLILFSQGGLFGAMDRTGSEKVAPIYTSLTVNEAGNLLALKTDVWDDKPDGLYFIDDDGRESATGVKTMFSLDTFSEGRMPLLSAENNRYGYVDSQGRWAVRPQYGYALDYSDGYAIASISSGYGLIDESGNWVITPRYDFLTRSDGLLMGVQDNSMCTVFDDRTLEEKFRIEGEDLFAYQDNGYIVVMDKDAARLFDADGELVFSAAPTATLSVTETGLVLCYDGPWGSPAATLYRAGGEQLCESRQMLYPLGTASGMEYFACMHIDAEPPADDPSLPWDYDPSTILYSLMDETGRELGPAQFTDLSPASGEFFYASTEDRTGLLDTSGEWIASWPLE